MIFCLFLAEISTGCVINPEEFHFHGIFFCGGIFHKLSFLCLPTGIIAMIGALSAPICVSGVMHSPGVDFTRGVEHNELAVGKSG